MAQDDDEYTPDQKRKIARHFLYVAPHGEVKDLSADLKKVVPQLLTKEWEVESMTEYNKRRFVLAKGENKKLVICCPQGEVAKNQYLDPDSNTVCEIDPVTQKIINITQTDDPSGQYAGYRGEISAALKDYLSAHYEDGSSSPLATSRGFGAVYASAAQDRQGQIAIVISYKNLNVNNYWTGGWQSEWTFNVSQKKNTKLEGRIRLNVHYYEDGNVQLNSTFNEAGEVDVGSEAETASRVINIIKTLENDFQLKLEKFYVQMHDSTFKNMRRFLPKTGQKMDWRSSVHALAAEAASH